MSDEPVRLSGFYARFPRFLFLSRVWSEWRSALAIVQAETVIAWIVPAFASSGPRRCGVANRDDLLFPVTFEI